MKTRRSKRIQVGSRLIAPSPEAGGPQFHNSSTHTNWGCQCSYCVNAMYVRQWNRRHPEDKMEIVNKDGGEVWQEIYALANAVRGKDAQQSGNGAMLMG